VCDASSALDGDIYTAWIGAKQTDGDAFLVDMHGGGDNQNVWNFIQMMRKKEVSISSLEDGMLSALMCLKAKDSSVNKKFESIKY